MGNQNKTLDDIFQEPKQHAMLRKGGTALVLFIIGITLLIVGSNGGFQEKALSGRRPYLRNPTRKRD